MPRRCATSATCGHPRRAPPESGRAVVSRAEVGLSAQLERTIAGESFSAHLNRRRLQGLP